MYPGPIALQYKYTHEYIRGIQTSSIRRIKPNMKNRIKKIIFFFIRKFSNENDIWVMKKVSTDLTTTRPDYSADIIHFRYGLKYLTGRKFISNFLYIYIGA